LSRRICIDGFNLGKPKGSGIATYGRNLNVALRQLGYQTQILHGPQSSVGPNNLLNQVAINDAPEAAYKVTLIDQYLTPYVTPFGRWAREVVPTEHVLPSPASKRVVVDSIWAARDVFHGANRRYARTRNFTPVHMNGGKRRPEAMHWTAPLPMRVPGMPNLYTLHDLVPLRLPFTTLDNKRRFYFLCKRLCRKADHIVTVSESARQDILRTFKIDESRVTNTYQSVDFPPALLKRTDEEVAAEIEGIFGLGWRRYYLFYGAVEPKKNLGRVIEAYLASGVKDPLVIIGGDGWLTEFETKMLYGDIVTLQSVRDNVIRRTDRIRRYDYLPLPSLVSLIRGAKATLFPSLYEGFGLPVLESMLLGTPVLTSDGGSLPEVAGDAALTVDPYDSVAIQRGIQALDADEALREDLIARGRVQAAKFSVKAHSDRLQTIYDRLI
jgi:glycosyltransferase involved in cell wall biosynthesis